MTRFAAIDIGSNAIRLCIIEADPPAESWPALLRLPAREVVALRAPVRLGKEVFLTNTLTAQSLSAAVETLRHFREVMDKAHVDHYRAVATSAVREAKNGLLLVERAHRDAGVRIEIIEGIEEARLVQLAVTRTLSLEHRRALLLDVGGGSTELTLLDHGELRAAQSLPLGTVRLLEAFLGQEAVVGRRTKALVREYVERVFATLSPELTQIDLNMVVATGGTVDTLASLCPCLTPDGPALDLLAMHKLLGSLLILSPQERMTQFGLRPDRADTIVPAIFILSAFAERFRKGALVTPGVGLKEGVLEELVGRSFSRWNDRDEEDAIRKACLRLGRHYSFDEPHGVLVARFATQLFDDLQELHGLEPRDRLLLTAAALLHDIGDFIRYEGHHKHSCYLIEHSDIMGITPIERSLIATIARYHRKSFPDTAHIHFRDLNRDDRAKVRALAALLRLADALDREHRGKISAVRATLTGGSLLLSVEGSPDRELEEWTVAQKSNLFQSVFHRDVKLMDSRRSSIPPIATT